MNQWLRIVIVLGLLLASLSILALGTREATLPARAPEPKVPRLVRTADGVPEVSAEAILITRVKTGEELFSRNPAARLPIASLTKLMTAMLLDEVGQPLASVEFSPGAKTAGAPDDKRSRVAIGDTLKVEDVLKLLLISSDTDAAYAAAEYVGGFGVPPATTVSFEDRVAAFVNRMNERAGALGLTDTHFSNPSGQDAPDNFSSARDMAKLAEVIERSHPELWAISRTQEMFVFGRGGERYGVINTNPLLAEYPAIYSSKTGFDDEAKGALLVLYQIAPGEFITMVLLRSGDRFGDGRALIRWLESSFMLE